MQKFCLAVKLLTYFKKTNDCTNEVSRDLKYIQHEGNSSRQCKGIATIIKLAMVVRIPNQLLTIYQMKTVTRTLILRTSKAADAVKTKKKS